MIKRINSFLKIFYFYLALNGMFGFAAFIYEESLQMLTFSMFTVKDTQRWDIGKSNLETMEKLNKQLSWFVKYCLWINPFQSYSYKSFVEATEGYIEAGNALVLANAPELFINTPAAFKFYYKSITQDINGEYILKAGKIIIKTNKYPSSNPIYVSGRLIKLNNNLFEIRI